MQQPLASILRALSTNRRNSAFVLVRRAPHSVRYSCSPRVFDKFLFCSGPLGAQSSSPMQLANPKAQSQLLSRWLGAFYLGSPLYRTIVGSLSGIGIALFLTALSLAVAHFVGAAQWLIIATAIVVGFIALTLLCATPSGAASQLFKSVIPVTSLVTFAMTLVVSISCTSCSWIIYPALLFGITFALLLIARLQVRTGVVLLR